MSPFGAHSTPSLPVLKPMTFSNSNVHGGGMAIHWHTVDCSIKSLLDSDRLHTTMCPESTAARTLLRSASASGNIYSIARDSD